MSSRDPGGQAIRSFRVIPMTRVIFVVLIAVMVAVGVGVFVSTRSSGPTKESSEREACRRFTVNEANLIQGS